MKYMTDIGLAGIPEANITAPQSGFIKLAHNSTTDKPIIVDSSGNKFNIINVQPDWNQTVTTADDFIKNKPTIVAAAGIAIIEDVKAYNIAGGTWSAGSWRTHTLNTIVSNTAQVTLSTNRITVDPGSYHIYFTAIGYNVGAFIYKLVNITDYNTALLLSTTGSSLTANMQVEGNGLLTFTSQSTLELLGWGTTTRSTTGFGAAHNINTTPAINNIYARVVVVKLT